MDGNGVTQLTGRGVTGMDRMLSIIIPVYNTAAFLEPCIDSVLRQTIRQYEILMMDLRKTARKRFVFWLPKIRVSG